ncbi:MAG TPA: hypothetical protein VFX59_20485 [Polyangiales bacterium]|nr:hypothetical protein [Polyangiales bacterium]
MPSRAATLCCLALASLALGCMQAAQTYALRSSSPDVTGQVSIERIEGGQKLVVLQLEQLPPPERLAPGLREYVVWLQDPRGAAVKVGTLDYDRAHQSGNLLATTDLPAFTVRVTGERDANTSQPSGVLLAERNVLTN